MKNVLTILRRDIGAYYTSPIGYIFMIVFVLISVGLYITSFFTFPIADMRPYFSNLPLLLCVFIPAVTMRVWAEERKENTWEMLLTFPMRSWELVLGKFFACFVFYALTVAATFTIPLMLVSLGNPDNGALIGGYIGTLLLGAFFLAIGIFFSGFFKDQIVAFVVTLLACFGIFLLGNDFIAGYIDSMMAPLGTLLSRLVGMAEHYESFTRGVIELADVVYFAAWTVLFLTLNVMYIEGRLRPKSRMTFAGAVVMCAAIGLMFNYLVAGASIIRYDGTEDKIYTVSPASKEILSRSDAPVTVKLYITPQAKMPTQLKNLEQQVIDKLEELRLASNGKLQYSSVYLEVANVLAEEGKDKKEDKNTEEEAVEKRMLDKGVEPFSVRAIGEDEVTNKLIYSSIGIGYKDKREEIIPQVVPQTVEELEYRVVSTVYKLTREKEPVVALVAPKESMNIDPQMRMMLEQMGRPVPQQDDPYEFLEQVLTHEKYKVERVDLTQSSPLPSEFDTLVVVNPRSLNERQRWEINRVLISGKPVIMAVQNYEWEYRPTRAGTSLSKREEKPQVNELLSHYGLGISDEILMDVNHVPLTLSSGSPLESLMGGGQTVNLPMQILVNNGTMDGSTSITSRLSMVFYLWGSPLTIDPDTLKKNGLDNKVLISTTKQAWTVPGSKTLTQQDLVPPAAGGNQFPLMAMITGQFPDAYKEQQRPAWPQEQAMPGQPPKPPVPEEGEVKPVTPAPGKLILLGCSEPFRKNFLQAGNMDLFMNSVDAVTLGDELVNVRGRKPVDRAISMPDTSVRRKWKIINYSLATVVIAAVGIVSSQMRRRARNAYTVAYGSSED
jgi:ABC-type transport system involved in multi-copper enzyme maturation permease subunit